MHAGLILLIWIWRLTKETWKQMMTRIQATFDEEVANALEALRNEDGEDKAAATTLYEAKMKSEQPPATATNKAKCA